MNIERCCEPSATGLTIVRNLDPSSTFIAKLNLVPNDWARVQPLLGRS